MKNIKTNDLKLGKVTASTIHLVMPAYLQEIVKEEVSKYLQVYVRSDLESLNMKFCVKFSTPFSQVSIIKEGYIALEKLEKMKLGDMFLVKMVQSATRDIIQQITKAVDSLPTED